MASGKLDRRKKYTRMVLKNSLMEILKEKPIASITVKEICELADINRSTFYAHYADQYDLLNKMEEEILEDMITYLQSYNFEKEEEALQMMQKLLEYFASKKEICQILFNENSDSSFQQKVMEIAQQFIWKNWEEINHLDKALTNYLSTFIISGSIHVAKKWLFNEMDKSPKEMAEIIYNIINKGLLALK